MTRYLTHIVVFLAGLAVVCWIGGGYAGSNMLALAITLAIGGFYVAGALELLRYRQATFTLTAATKALSEAPASLAGWLDRLHPSLRDTVRLRVEGERVALPGPSLTPYLVGLVVLLGMLGTFLGMVSTLRGTGLALESAADMAAIRASLAAPVKGLGFAFGTSVAGVATSAMLGLLSALCRRERIEAAQALDARIGTTLRSYSRGHQRDESFRLQQRQADAMPALLDRLQGMLTAMEQQNQTLIGQLAASQEAFHGKTEAVYTRLASSVEQSLKDSVADSTRAASAALQPAVDATMAGLARETAAMRETVVQAVQAQLEGVSTRFDASTTRVTDIWTEALGTHQRTSEAAAQDLRTSLDGFAGTFAQRSTELLDTVSTRLESAGASVAASWEAALARQERASEAMAGGNQRALATAAAAFEQHAAAMTRTVTQSHADLQADLASRDEQRLAGWTDSLGAVAATLRQQWEHAAGEAASRQQVVCDALTQTASDISAQGKAHAASTLAEIDRLVNAAAEAAAHAPQAAAALQTDLAARDEQRLALWTETLGTVGTTLREEWEKASTEAASRQQAVCDALTQTAGDISAQGKAHATSTLAEIDRLVNAAAQAAAQAPQAAAALQTDLVARDEQRLALWTETLGTIATTLRHDWNQVTEQAASRQQAICDALTRTASDISTQATAHATGTLAGIDRLVQAAAEAPKAAATLQSELVSRDEQRLAAWTAELGAMASTLREQWERANASTASRQQEICETLARTAQDITAQSQAQASNTITEVSRLVQAATEAPKAAAEIIGELRQSLSDGMARDNAMLDERSRLLATLGTLLDAVNHASSEQRTAVDTMLASTAEVLERVGSRFTDKIESETDRLGSVAAQVTGSAVEVASLGESFGVAVQLFSDSSEKLMTQLQRIETALDSAMSRSDEQLAYYVAQAREVVDLSMMSQKQILEDMQQLSSQRAPDAEAA